MGRHDDREVILRSSSALIIVTDMCLVSRPWEEHLFTSFQS